MRRSLILVLALSLLELGPVPLSACALVSSKLAECATPQTQDQCDKMDMDESGTHFAATPDTSCCLLKAPLPVSQYKSSDLSFPATLEVASAPIGIAPLVHNIYPAVSIQDISPPGRQSLLCTFLI
ncbi:MAG TPA: hypothetical protein VNH65_08170 [Candidatus Acidoferrum sp.]|nr:hypothetical protein [Candidatus Acidoferrum sp.]